MSQGWWLLLVILLWVLTGVLAAAVFVIRGGHRSLLWYALGALLGPLFVPIAIERGRRRSRYVEAHSRSPGRPGPAARVLVGVDGSADADRALRTVVQVLPGSAVELIMVAVLDQDLVEADAGPERARLRRLLADLADRTPPDLPVPVTEIVTGPPAEALLTVADRFDADVIVIGRRGYGLSERLLGSVAQQLAHRSPRPVLLGGLAQGE